MKYQGRMSGWSVYRIDEADYLVGVVSCGEINIVRVSTAIVEFSKELMTVKTAAGVFINLVGEPKKSILEMVCLYHISIFSNGSEYKDLTGSYWPEYKYKEAVNDLSAGPFMKYY